MGAEIGATTSIFPYDNNMSKYLNATSRDDLVVLADNILPYLKADLEVYEKPELFYDDVIDIDLSLLEPICQWTFYA